MDPLVRNVMDCMREQAEETKKTNRFLIFNTNHYGDIFDSSSVDEKSEALESRSILTVSPMKKKEVVEYLNTIITNIRSEAQTEEFPKTSCIDAYDELKLYDESKLQTLYSKIPDNITVSYRSMVKIIRNCNYNLEEIIEVLTKNNIEKTISQQHQHFDNPRMKL